MRIVPLHRGQSFNYKQKTIALKPLFGIKLACDIKRLLESTRLHGVFAVSLVTYVPILTSG
jgi:hypothetical protein